MGLDLIAIAAEQIAAESGGAQMSPVSAVVESSLTAQKPFPCYPPHMRALEASSSGGEAPLEGWGAQAALPAALASKPLVKPAVGLAPPAKRVYTKRQPGRPTHTPEQKAVMARFFDFNPLPSAKEREELAKAIGLTPRAVQVWFQNRRQRHKEARETNTMRKTDNQIPLNVMPTPAVTHMPAMPTAMPTAIPTAIATEMPPTAYHRPISTVGTHNTVLLNAFASMAASSRSALPAHSLVNLLGAQATVAAGPPAYTPPYPTQAAYVEA